MRRRGASGWIGARRSAAFLGSAVFHAALLVLLARYLAQTAQYGDVPAMQVSLVPKPLRPDRADRDLARRRRSEEPNSLAPTKPALRIRAPSVPPGGEAAPLASGGAAPGGDELAERGRQVLLGLRGCDRAQLTREERERCEARRWIRTAPIAVRLNLDPSGRYAENPEPFLSRRPTKGCRLRATGDQDPAGDDSHARAGITCVKPF